MKSKHQSIIADAELMLRVFQVCIIQGFLPTFNSPCYKRMKKIQKALKGLMK